MADYRETESLLELIKELKQQLQKLEEKVDQLSQKESVNPIQVEHMTVQNMVMDHLTFRLDQMNIKELSGALNLGNNFGVENEKKSPPKKSNPPKKEPANPPQTEELPDVTQIPEEKVDLEEKRAQPKRSPLEKEQGETKPIIHKELKISSESGHAELNRTTKGLRIQLGTDKKS